MNTTTPSPGLSPIRIYVLWHPDFDWPAEFHGRPRKSLSEDEKRKVDRGQRLARRIYHWFRLETMDGIPVYFRSTGADGGEAPLKIDEQAGITNYIIPLVDANMVSSPEWRAYVAHFAGLDVAGNGSPVAKAGENGGGPEANNAGTNIPSTRLLPVAIEPVAYNMPEILRRLNFIRHDLSGEKQPADMDLISKLTEVICRHMRAQFNQTITHGTPPQKLKIFLSHAKADDTVEAAALKDFIQRETQCEAFFDETDIASGYDYEAVLQEAISRDSAGLIVIHGDHYADRPWCRKEIRDFLKPVDEGNGTFPSEKAFFIPPVVVVQTMRGPQIARTIPELGHAPCVRWKEDRARLVVTTLLREILLGLFYRQLVRLMPPGPEDEVVVVVNRPPDPVMINRINAAITIPKNTESDTSTGRRNPCSMILHPGYGLSTMEQEGLRTCFPNMKFSSFHELTSASPPDFSKLAGKVIALSVGNATDALAHGIGDEHNKELLVRLMRPLMRSRASILYGGAMPAIVRPPEPWLADVNFTALLLYLLLSERSAEKGNQDPRCRLYNLSTWPRSEEISKHMVAQWTDVCSFIKLPADKAARIPVKRFDAGELHDEEDLTDNEKRAFRKKRKKEEKLEQEHKLVNTAICLTAMRRLACGKLKCTLPDRPPNGSQDNEFCTFAHIFLGGKTMYSSGIIPGVFEEILNAFNERKPVFLIGEGRGAAGLVARWLADIPDKKPAELTTKYYQEKGGDFALVSQKLGELAAIHEKEITTPGQALDNLWCHIQKAATDDGLKALMNNELSGEENRSLFLSRSFVDICDRVWRGIDRLTRKEDAT